MIVKILPVSNNFISLIQPTGPGDLLQFFFFLGGEGPLRPSSVGDHFVVSLYAAKFGALVVSLEHRFYGESIPYEDSSTEHLRFLSSQQALADAAYFRNYLVDKLNLSPDAKWIVFGGSYSGNLAAWFRLKYPHLVVGAIATSGPVKAQLDFPEYFQVVATSIGSKCNAAVTNATKQMESLIQTSSGRQQLKDMWNLCQVPETEDDIAMFFSDTADPICETVQYNNDNVGYTPYNIPQMCDMILSNPDPLKGWIDFYNAYSQTTDCLDISYDNYIQEMQETSSGRSWVWQTCTEFGYYQTAETTDQPFSSAISLDWYVDMCTDVYGIEGLTPDIDWTNTFYGSTDIQVSNVVFPDGSVDPWHVLALLDSDLPTSPSIYMNGTAHCADLYPPAADDPEDLTNCRTQEVNLIAQWLSQK